MEAKHTLEAKATQDLGVGFCLFWSGQRVEWSRDGDRSNQEDLANNFLSVETLICNFIYTGRCQKNVYLF